MIHHLKFSQSLKNNLKLREKDEVHYSELYSIGDPNYLLKQGIWAYFLLLIFEGALRKWFFPGLATPLLLARDPIALWVLVNLWHRNMLPSTLYLGGTILIGIVGIFTATLIGHGSLPVALYGARILLLHFPLMFAIGVLFGRQDVIQMGRMVLWLAIPMALLTAVQFFSPQSAWVNRGVGGDMAGAGFGGAEGYFRPPGTFSFTNGLSAFFGLVGVFTFYFWIDGKNSSRLLLVGATIALLAAIPLTISRGLLFQIGVTSLFSLMLLLVKPEYIGKLIKAGMGMIITLAILYQTSFFQTATGAFTSRFTSANQQEGGMEGVLIDRYLGGMVGALFGADDIPFFGYGLGMGTNVGSMLLSGSMTFLISEGEWGRILGELGLVMGLGLILIRLLISLEVAIASYQKMRMGDVLPWLLLSLALTTIPQGQWAQPTALGFSTLIGGLILASLREYQIKP